MLFLAPQKQGCTQEEEVVVGPSLPSPPSAISSVETENMHAGQANM